MILNGIGGEKRFVVASGSGVVRTGHIFSGEDGLHARLGEGGGDVQLVEGGMGHLREEGVGVEGSAIETDVVGVKGVTSDMSHRGFVGSRELGGDFQFGERYFVF